MSKKSKSLVRADPDIVDDRIPASDRLLTELTIATDASIGVIVVRVPETEVYRVVDDLYSLAMSQKVEFRTHTSETGWATYETIDVNDTRAPVFDPIEPKTVDKTTADVAKAFASFAKDGALQEDGYYLMLDLYFSFGEMKTQTCIRKQAQRALGNGQRLFLIVPQHAEVPDAIAPLMHVIEFDYPTRTELDTSLDDILGSLEDTDRPTVSYEERLAIIANGQGMTTHSFETAIALSITTYSAENDTMEGFTALDIMSSIRDYKTQMLRKTNVLELQPAIDVSEVGGLDLFKSWMLQRRETFTDRAKELGVTPSRGCLVVGPPGTGKSLVGKAAGSMLSLPVIRFDVGRVFGQYIGQSEGAMRTVLAMIDAMAPCVLMLDEIDKGFSGMGGSGGDHNGGTTQRVFGTFLTWMQERDQKSRPVFLIMTANRVSGLPPELLRKGRVDEIWSVNVPNDEERRAIISIHAAKRQQELLEADMPSMVRITQNLVGAEIEGLIEDALVMSLGADTAGITYELLDEAKTYLKPMSATRKDEFDAMRVWAETNARPASSSMQQIASTTEAPAKRPKITRKRPKAR